ncbi:ADP-ribosylation factor-like protein 4C [Cherax quadricarinatus]|uniref:ADP-ribosylation factor-like protein 4C n=1 Tax=Cherax quadricarinatus TaxID=27406 RepID=UPI0023792BE4|nr:ADP-ribosylation factor-like protein 4C [Cherax quadricarinatus]
MGVHRVVEVAQSLVFGLVALVSSPPHVVLVGLDSSGKTTALLRLKYGQYVNAVPTVGFNCEKVRCGGGQWLVWDVGGAERVRPLWRSYTRATDALIFVVDSSSGPDRLEEARLELHRLTRQQNHECLALNRARPPLLVLANKQDLPGAKDTQQLAKALGLPDLPQPQAWAVAAACAVTGEGLDEAMAALHHLLLKTKKTHKTRK